MARKPLPSAWKPGGLPPMTGGAQPAVNPQPQPLLVRRPVAKQPGDDQSAPVPQLPPNRYPVGDPHRPGGKTPSGGSVGHLGGNN